MKDHKEKAKSAYLKFIEKLKLESSSDRSAFKETLDEFASDLRKMGDYIKNNEGKKVLTNDNDKDKNDIKSALSQAIVK